MSTKHEITQYQSFLLRLWQTGEADGTAAWQGEIESIQSGQTWCFADLVIMEDFLKTQVLGKRVIEFDQEND